MRADCRMKEKRGSRPISRVLSWATIPLGRTSPCASSDLPGSTRGQRAAARAACFPIWSCSGRGLPCRSCCQDRGALLPHPFTLASCRTSPSASAVCFLLHFPWACAPQALPGALPYGARTFLAALTRHRWRARPGAIAWPTPGGTIGAKGPDLKAARFSARAPFDRGACAARR
jgi:hypothetical protein